MYIEIELVAIETPAIKAPISRERPASSAISARPRHQPIAIRKMYSWKASNLANSFNNTNLTNKPANMMITGRLINTRITFDAPGSGRETRWLASSYP